MPYQQASETERRLVLQFYASQGHQVPRPPSSFSGLADQVAQQVRRWGDIMAANSSAGPPSYEQATSLEGLRVFLQVAVNSGAAPFQTIDWADAYESSSIQIEEDYQEMSIEEGRSHKGHPVLESTHELPASVHLEDDVCDSESSGEWHLPGIAELNELEDQRAVERTRLASLQTARDVSVIDTQGSSSTKNETTSSRESRRYQLQQPLSTQDKETDPFDFSLWSDLVNHDWQDDANEFEYDERNLGPD